MEDPATDARLLLAEALGCDAGGLILRSGNAVEPPALGRLRAMVARRIEGEPVHRIFGRRAFYDHDFALSAETLEPRADTETLVELCRQPIEAVLAARGACLIADVGTGTGAIAVSLLALYAEAEAIAIDLSPGALVTARRNALAAGVAPRFHAVAGDYLSAIGAPVDIVVSNPPYIRSGDIAGLAREVREFDPHLALDGGPDGLDAYRALACQSAERLRRPGHALVEIGQGQASDVCEIFSAAGLVLAASRDDLAGIPRALWFQTGK
nr:peptide chain release factor N(5)-glutamine methyltransferase [Aureimonas sp. SA4125]